MNTIIQTINKWDTQQYNLVRSLLGIVLCNNSLKGDATLKQCETSMSLLYDKQWYENAADSVQSCLNDAGQIFVGMGWGGINFVKDILLTPKYIADDLCDFINNDPIGKINGFPAYVLNGGIDQCISNKIQKFGSDFANAELEKKSEMTMDILCNVALLCIPGTAIAKFGKAGEAVEVTAGLSKVEKKVKVAGEIDKSVGAGKLAETEQKTMAAEAIKGNLKSTLSELDAKGYDEFLKKTKGVFLSDNEAQKAFKEFLDQDYDSFVSHFNLSTEPNKAYFWSKDKKGAAVIAEKSKGTIMETTLGGRFFDNWKYLDERFDPSCWGRGGGKDGSLFWASASAKYAEGASGTVYYVLPRGMERGYTWMNIERPILASPTNTKAINVIQIVN